MRNQLVMDEFHVTFFVPRGLSDRAYDSARAAIDDRRFRRRVRRCVARMARRHPALLAVTVKLSG